MNTNVNLHSAKKNKEDEFYTQPVYIVYKGDKNNNKKYDDKEIEVYSLEGNGDFSSKECIKSLKQANIVVTDPPFYLFREYISNWWSVRESFLLLEF